jgi:hypothetical protein
MKPQQRPLAATIVAGLALLAALWLLAIGPKRSERAALSANVVAQQTRLDAGKAEVAMSTASRKQFSGLLTELRGLDEAVPARVDVSAMLRELQRRAKVRDSELRIVALKDPGGAVPGMMPGTPGAITGAGGLSALPFTFEYTGRYFDLLDILKTVRHSVRVTSGDLNVDGRLLTIDGLSFNPVAGNTKLTKAVMNATAYIAPDAAAAAPAPPAATPGAPAPPAATPAAPAPAATEGGS